MGLIEPMEPMGIGLPALGPRGARGISGWELMQNTLPAVFLQPNGFVWNYAQSSAGKRILGGGVIIDRDPNGQVPGSGQFRITGQRAITAGRQPPVTRKTLPSLGWTTVYAIRANVQ